MKALHVTIEPKATATVRVQAVPMGQARRGSEEPSRPSLGGVAHQPARSLLGHIAITPGREAGRSGTPYSMRATTSDRGEREKGLGASAAGLPQAHAVQLLLRPERARKATLLLQPEQLTFEGVQVGRASGRREGLGLMFALVIGLDGYS